MTRLPFSLDLLIDGKRVPGGGALIESINPATEQAIASVPTATVEQVDEAVRAARRAFDSGPWGRMSGNGRGERLRALATALSKRREQFADLIRQDVGTPVGYVDAFQVGIAIDYVKYYADLADVDRTEFFPPIWDPVGSQSAVRYVPIGVVAAIAAYNLPLTFITAKVSSALAAGCTAVVIPSPLSPLTSLLFAEAVEETDLPPGVINVLVGQETVGRRLTEHPLVDKVSFTGSVAVGSQVMRQAAATVKDITLELGGKSPNILLPGTDYSAVAAPIHMRFGRNAGQGCSCPTRILVEADRFDEFIDASRSAWSCLVVGDPTDPATLVGPVISAAQRARVQGYVDGALADGAKILVGGGPPDSPRGYFVQPMLIGGVTNDSRICQEEIFGPVAVVLPYRDVEEGIDIANDTRYGLAANVWGPDPKQCFDVAHRMRAGSVYINGGGGFRPDVPFGGLKASGVGREFGEWGIRDMLAVQHVQWTI